MNGMRFVSVLTGPAVLSLLRHLPGICKCLLRFSMLAGIAYNVSRIYENTARMLAIAEAVFGAVQAGPRDGDEDDDDMVQFWLDEHVN